MRTELGSRAACFLGVLSIAVCGCSKPSPTSSPVSSNETAPSARATSTAVASAASHAAPGSAAELVVYVTGERTLRGFLARPAGDGRFPVLVYNHGSEKLPGDKAGQITFFTRHGFVVFVPHRRGHGRSEGPYVIDEANAAGERRGEVIADRLAEQVDDVAAAVSYVKGLSFVDPSRVAVAGCSFGGIESLLAAERDLGIRAAIDFAGAAMTWSQPGSQPIRDRMTVAARRARVPVFFLQAENDFDVAPTRILSEEMKKHDLPHRAKIFPPNGTTHEEGHGFCKGGEAPPWGPDVLDFLAQTMPAR
ncbi:MAG TPA: dienelactone hydrolase family protein [Polyangiaceae bacterium]|nr:dienelactone hydrolase family protein [Polyangiaceae bacterium]